MKKYYTEEDSFLIKGENLTVLKELVRSGYKEKIKLIYIDPPFATNTTFRFNENGSQTISSSLSDEIAYKDNLTGDEYFKFIKSRLLLLHELLTDDGSLYFHIDYKIGHYIKIILDEVFGIDNFRNDITRIKCNPKNFNRKGYGNIKDMILFYTKSDTFTWNTPREPYSEDDICRLFKKRDKNGNRYTTTPLHAPGETKSGPTGQKWKGMAPPKGRHWRYPPSELTKLDKEGLVEWSSTGNPRKIVYAKERILKGKLRQDIWEFKDPQHPKYPTQKNQLLLDTIVNTSSNSGDYVLDAFMGSGTTLVSAKQLGRKWIGIDNSENALKISSKRLSSINIQLKL